MEVERASLCNLVINFLLEESYLLTALELLHELSEDGHADRALRLQQFFADPDKFPPGEISRMQNLQVPNPQQLAKERDDAEERAAIIEYELRLAQEDVNSLKEKLERKPEAFLSTESNGEESQGSPTVEDQVLVDGKNRSFSSLGPLQESERRVLNIAIKEFLLTAGYKLTAMTFYEEVDQDLDAPQIGPANVPDALRRFYLHFLSTCLEEIEEKALLKEERESLLKDKEMLVAERDALRKDIEALEWDKSSLVKSLESAQKEIKDKDRQNRLLKESLQQDSKDLNECRIEITSLKLELESSRATRKPDNNLNEDLPSSAQERLDSYRMEIASLKMELELIKSKGGNNENEVLEVSTAEETHIGPGSTCSENPAVDIHEDTTVSSKLPEKNLGDIPVDIAISSSLIDGMPDALEDTNTTDSPEVMSNGMRGPESEHGEIEVLSNVNCYSGQRQGSRHLVEKSKQEIETVEILADALPKIVPFVLINHREELLPLMMCAIERHPDSNVRDLLTHTLFNLIKRPDENQRRIIMDACLTLSKNIGEERTELELLPQCWEQINHKYEERRLLVAQSCGELAQFVKPDMRTSLILSIVHQLVEDPAAVVREAAAHNLAMLLPLFPNVDKYFKVEELMFQLVCDPSGIVVETTLKELVPAVISWAKLGNRPLSQLLRSLLSHLLGSAQRCPPVSGVEGTAEAQLHVLGERERWNVDVLLRMLTEVLPEVSELARGTCPYLESGADLDVTSIKDSFPESLIQAHLRENMEWPAFDWLHIDCLPALLQLACMLPSREDSLRTRLSKLLLAMSKHFGNHYLSSIMLPIFLIAVGDNSDISHFPIGLASRVKGLKPKNATGERLATVCILPLLLAGVLGEPSMQEQLSGYLRTLVLHYTAKHGAWTPAHTPELIDAIRFLCTFEEQHNVIVGVLWELVVNSNADVKIGAASLLKVLVSYVDMKFATTHVLPALVTLGSDPNLHVKYSSIDAFGAVAQHFKDEMIVDKIRVQMDAFLEDGSHEAAVAVVRALAVAVPLTTSSLRDYLLHKLLLLSGATTQGTTLMRRRERADAFCEAIRALDATDLSLANIREQLLPAIQNLLKDPDALDPAHKEALEVIVKERSGGRLDSITKAMGTHLSMSGMTSLFGDSGLLGKKDNADLESLNTQPPQQEEGRLMRIMRGNFGEMIRGRGKTNEDLFPVTP